MYVQQSVTLFVKMLTVDTLPITRKVSHLG